MRGNAQVIAQLNHALKEELTAINQYFLHAEMCHNWGYHGLGDFIRKQSIDEMKHAEELIERILFLDATPAMEYMELKVGSNVKQQLEADLQLETNAVAMYNKAVQIARDNGDDQSRELFSKLLKDEEEHVDWLEAQHAADEPPSRLPWVVGLGAMSLALTAGAVSMGVLAQVDASGYLRAAAVSDRDVDSLRRRAEAEHAAAWTLGGAALAAASSAAAVWIFDLLTAEP